jgi:regulator of protease activity HflC (stomatin/prohibitin superfamily)
MSEIRQHVLVRHLRAEPTSHVLRYRKGRLVSSGRGGAFWFRPLSAAIAEVPVDDREQSFHFAGRTADFQDVAVQGTITYRVADPELAARRIDFGIDLDNGVYLTEPLARLAQMVGQAAQQLALDWIAHRTLEAVLREAVQDLRPLIVAGLGGDTALADVGLEIATVSVTRVAPTPDLEKALQAPTRERVQQSADEAAFGRRALAVEKERAIAENELNNRVELARREEQLIAQTGANERRRAEDEATAKRIAATAQAERSRVASDAQADGIRSVKAAENEAERVQLDAYRDLPSNVLMGMALRELAGNFERIDIDHLSINPDGIGALLETLIGAGTRSLEAASSAASGVPALDDLR